MLPKRTPKGLEELRSGERVLSLRQRSILFLADGRKSMTELEAGMGSDARAMVAQLQVAGYLELIPSEAAAPQRAVASPATSAGSRSSGVAPTHEADSFSGRRSLAGVRMYLFDVCERTFTRGAPATAEAFRERLRNARDRAPMLAVADDLVAEIELLAGAARASTVRDRIDALLPGPDE